MKPEIVGEYFKWRHSPSKGGSVVLPGFGEEVECWWRDIQPEWRYNDEASSNNNNNYSYILAGGKKGVYLLILCLAWWDKAYARKVEREKAERRADMRAAGKDDTHLDFSDLPDHDWAWFNIVNDLTFVLELARRAPVPSKETSGTAGGSSGRRKRTTEGTDSSPRKKKKTT